MYRISQELAEMGKKRIEGFPVDGFVWGSVVFGIRTRGIAFLDGIGGNNDGLHV